MGFKLYTRNLTLLNLIGFIIFSYLLIYALFCIAHGANAFDLHYLTLFLKRRWESIPPLVLSFFFVWRGLKVSKIFVALFFLYCLVCYVRVFFFNFDKMILLFCVVYAILSFCFYFLWSEELARAIYNHKYDKRIIGQKVLTPIEICFEFISGLKLNGLITHFDESTCFVLLKEQIDVSITGQKLKVRFFYEGHEFLSLASIVSSYENGFGIVFEKEENLKGHTWKDLYEILSDRSIITSSLF